MRHFNLVKSFTRLNNITSLPFRKGLGLGRLFILSLALATFGVNEAWGKAERSWSASVAVGSGKGSVKVVIYKHGISKSEEKTATSTNSTIQTASLSASGTTVLSISNRSCQYFVNSADAGYSWDAWYTNAACTSLHTRDQSFEAWSKTTDNQTVTYYAKFTPNTNTAYTVKHYKQNLAGTGYDLADTDNLTGTTDTKVTPARKSYTGFTAPAGKEVNIEGDGSRVVEYYYDRKSYSLTWNLDGGTITTAGTPAGQVKYEATLIAPTVSKSGALSNGWSPSVPATMPANDVTYTAQWVSKYNIEVTGSDQNMKVGGTQDDAFTFVHKENPTPYISVISIDAINNGDGQVIEYDAAHNKIIAHNAGTATIYFTQAETETMYESTSASFTYTVIKHDNHISINNSQDSYQASIYMDAQQSINLTATNTDYAGSPITANQTAGNTIAVLNAAQTQVTSNYNLGDATWTVSQPENYKYKAANAMFTIHVVKQAEATDCYVKDLGSQTLEGKLGGETNKFTWIDQNAAGTLSYQVVGQKVLGVGSVGNSVQAYQLVNGAWIKAGKSYDDYSNDNYTPNEVTLDPTATGFYFTVAGSYASTLKDIHVTRNTFLNAADVEITKTQSNNPIYPGEIGVGTLTINHSLANGGDLKIVWDNHKFTIDGKTAADGINLGDKGCSTGVTNLPISYVSSIAGSDNANVIIYNNVYRATATITGTTIKNQQVITWKENIDILTAGTDIADPANSTLGNVTYTSSDETVISVEGNTIHALRAGTATITASSNGNTYFDDAKAEKEITVTDDKVQYIVWNESFMNLKKGDSNKTLGASAQSDVVGCTTNGARQITYTSSNENVVKIVNTNQLQIIEVGTATITATQIGGKDADGHIYVPVSMQKKVIVRDPNAECVNYIYIQEGEWRKDLGWNSLLHQTPTYEIDFQGQEPGYYNVDYKGESHDVGINYYDGQVYIDQFVDNNWVIVQELGKPAEDQNLNTGNVNLNRKATKMRFRVDGYTGYYTFKDCAVTLARYLEATNSLNKFEAKVGANHKQTLSVKYSNIEGPLTLKLTSGTSFSIDKDDIEGECGSIGTADIVISYFPSSAIDEETDLLTITDGKNTTLEIHLTGSATKTSRHIVWNQEPTPIYTLQPLTLTAEAQTDLGERAGEVYYTLAGNSTASGVINSNVLSFTKAGTANITVNTKSDDKFTDAAAVTKSWIVNLTPTEVVTNPEIDGEIVYGAQLSDLKLKANTGAARNTVNQQPVEGTFAITSGDLSAAGEKTITVTFTPANTDMYASCTKDITVTVQKAQPDAIAHAGDIIYGVAVQTSILTNEGTPGTWSWTDENADQVLPVGTHEGLQVHFTPTDQTNYNEIDGTVSLSVTPPMENKFTNAAGDNDWNNPNNWSAGLVPEKMNEANVVVSGELNITEPIVVGSLTIEDGGNVNVLQGGDLTVQAASGEADAFGDLYVKNGGDVTLNGTLNVHDFVIESSIGTADGSSKSGQISHAEMLNFNEGDAYIDIHLDPCGTADDSQWYGFTVPFEVDIATGIYRQENDGSFKQLKDKTNFDIMQYNPTKRLTTGKGWEYYHGILHPGEFYYLAIDGTNNVYRFRKKTGAGFTTEAQINLQTNGDISNPNANWNPVGNPCLRYTTTDYDGFVQVYKNGQSAYLTVDASDVTYVVGCPFFVQAQEEGSLLLETSNATEGQFYAPRRMAVDKTKNQIQLLNQGKVEDQIFIMASEDATSDYKAGSDLLKAGVSKLCGQMWLNAYEQQLSVQDALLQGDEATYYMSLFAPKAGDYILHVNTSADSEEIYLTLNNMIIWNLSDGDYPISLSKGTNSEYGLVLQRTQPGISTDIKSSKTHQLNKFIHHEQMYILHNGQLYNAMGGIVK